jgi:hypothetical protein
MENQWNNKKIAKFAGLLYLVFILSSFFADLFGHIGFGDTETIINTILSNEFLLFYIIV